MAKKDTPQVTRTIHPDILNGYIIYGVSRNNPLHTHQYVYQAGKSTELALNNLVIGLNESLDNRELAVVTFPDIEGTFNNALPAFLYETTINRQLEKYYVTGSEQSCKTTALKSVVRFIPSK